MNLAVIHSTSTTSDISWLLGESGARTVASLAKRLHSKIGDQASMLTGENFAHYSPWLDVFQHHPKGVPLLALARQANQVLISNPTQLNELCTALAQDGRPLGLLESEDKQFEIDVTFSENTKRLFNIAIDLVRASHPGFAIKLDSLCQSVVPIRCHKPGTRSGGVGFSTHRARGAIFLGLPTTPVYPELELAINLAHELGHQVLMTYQSADPIIDGDLNQPVYSSVRKTMRPAIRSFHAVIALVSMVEFIRCLLRTSILRGPRRFYAAERLRALESDLRIGLDAMSETKLTPLGAQLFDEALRACWDFLR